MGSVRLKASPGWAQGVALTFRQQTEKCLRETCAKECT
jgi:hypothetical protein